MMSLEALASKWWTPGLPLAVGGPSKNTKGRPGSPFSRTRLTIFRSFHHCPTSCSNLGKDTFVFFPRLEQEVGQWWKDRNIVKRVLEKGDPGRPFVFFEGPPTANGRPGVHHLEARASKDIILRYRRMRGHRIIGDRGGWDTHGLPVEIEVEKELGFSGKPDIERYGIAEFN